MGWGGKGNQDWRKLNQYVMAALPLIPLPGPSPPKRGEGGRAAKLPPPSPPWRGGGLGSRRTRAGLLLGDSNTQDADGCGGCTVGGAIAGAAIGTQVGRNNNAPQVVTRDVQRCQEVPSQARPDFWDVTYIFRGQEHSVQLTSPPGPTLTVNRLGEPRT